MGKASRYAVRTLLALFHDQSIFMVSCYHERCRCSVAKLRALKSRLCLFRQKGLQMIFALLAELVLKAVCVFDQDPSCLLSRLANIYVIYAVYSPHSSCLLFAFSFKHRTKTTLDMRK